MNIETLLPWGEERVINTKNGPRLLRTAPIVKDSTFWTVWREDKLELKEFGVSVSRRPTGEWEANWWRLATREAREAAQALRDANVAARQAIRQEFAATLLPEQEQRLQSLVSKLKAYQVDPVRQLVCALDAYRGAVDTSDTGTGKTYSSLAACQVLNRPVYVVCPKAVRPAWKKVGLHFGMNVESCNYELLRRGGEASLSLLNPGKEEKFVWNLPLDTVIIFDECFIGGTKIQMADGSKKRIDQVQKGDKVKNAVGVGVVQCKMRKKTHNLVRVTTDTGPIICTKDHPFLTDQGWIKACNLNERHYLKTYDYTSKLLRVREKVPIQPLQEDKESTFLRSILLGEMENATAVLQTDDIFSRTLAQDKPSYRSSSCLQPAIGPEIFNQDEGKESNEKSTIPGQSLCNIKTDRTQALDPGWQWNRANTSRTNPLKSISKITIQLCHFVRQAAMHGLSNKLQSGYSISKAEVGSGVRWREPHESRGSQKRIKAQGIRVESVEVLKPKDFTRNGGSEVFNIEVSGHPSYVLENGAVVHNCHRLKDHRTYNCAMGLAAIEQGYTVLGLSATAADNPLQMKFIGGLCRLFPVGKFWDWAKDHGCNKGRFGMEFVGGRKILQRLHEEIFPLHGARIRIADLGDAFPDSQIAAEVYELNGNTAALNAVYDEMEAEIARLEAKVEEDSTRNACILTAILRARQRAELLKVPALYAMGQDAIDEDMSVAIFCNFDDTVNALMARFKTDCVIRGGQSPLVRENNRLRFQMLRRRRLGIHCPTPSAQDAKQALGRVWRAEGEENFPEGLEPSPIIICNIRAGGVGIGLQDLDGSKSIQRIFFAAGTVEETVCRQVQEKVDRIQTLNDGDLALPAERIRFHLAND